MNLGQGGFLTWDVFMNHPDRFAGAFPMSGGLWLRSEPERFERDGAKARAQREVAIAVIHGRADPVVRFAQSMDAVLVFFQAGFRRLRLFAPERLGHEFGLSPLPEAVDWLETMTTEEGAVALRAAREARDAGRWGDASLLAVRAEKGTKDEAVRRQAKEIAAASEKAAAEAARKIGPRIPAARDDSWVADFHAFRETFRGTRAAEPAFAAYDDLWKRHRGRAESLFAEARAAFERGEEGKAREGYRKIVAEAYASRAYFWAKDYLEGNPEPKGR
ncbi:MAG TPA: hypothetical protein VFI25_01210 [Planctomycetota bacterium]|jgi:hypothetical protein|nr:hypothetical protein [Planctomycetota bacterium]